MIYGLENEYISVNKIKEVISGILGKKSFDETREFINNAEVKLSEEEIKKYLVDKLMDEEPDLGRRVQKRSNRNNTRTRNSKEMIKEFIDDLAISAYSFDPFAIEYFNHYIDILKKKILKMLSILDQVEDKNNEEIYELLEDLDISINGERQIKCEDAERLTHAILYNISNLLIKLNEANKLETYFEFKISKDKLYRDGLDENDLYPSEKIQEKDLLVGDDKQFISLTDKQIEMIKKKNRENYLYIVKLVNSLQGESL